MMNMTIIIIVIIMCFSRKASFNFERNNLVSADSLPVLGNMGEMKIEQYRNPCYPVGGGKVACLPSYLIIGAMKCGTTSLDYYLQDHPSIVKHSLKEIRFFKKFYFSGIEWYSRHFKDVDLTDGRLIGEATPGYLRWPGAPDRMYLTVPNVKLIVALRDPSFRSYSQYHHAIRFSDPEYANHSFEDLVEEELQIFKHCNMYSENRPFPSFAEFDYKKWFEEKKLFYGECWKNCNACFPYRDSRHYTDYSGFGLLSKSLYYEQIQKFRELFPEKQIMYISYERFTQNPSLVMSELEDFLDIPRFQYESFPKQNNNTYPPPQPQPLPWPQSQPASLPSPQPEPLLQPHP
eukprot:TRINITY_DN7077_c0_g1_i1.p1 TRINITY_DN7077_c0_g1~~TRINITY_DN7077_c0_g1_i1.p1  ORF type:complete len:347 (-),score=34.18 TRINITY_DN7077_c0_g1_i1:15-1055(-)